MGAGSYGGNVPGAQWRANSDKHRTMRLNVRSESPVFLLGWVGGFKQSLLDPVLDW